MAGSWATMVADITGLPFPDNFFDMVICSEVLEHIPDQHSAIKEMIRVLRPGGDLIVSVPRYLPERICWALSDSYHQNANGHIRIYKKKELITLIENSGSRLWAFHFAHSLHTPYWWLKCLIGPNRQDSFLVNLYHRFLVWDMMKKPRMTRFLDHLLNPIIGKSIVFYLRKEKHVKALISRKVRFPVVDITSTAEFILNLQKPNGEIPWSLGGKPIPGIMWKVPWTSVSPDI